MLTSVTDAELKCCAYKLFFMLDVGINTADYT